ncbi:MAG: hypothetical protein ABSD28_13505 [Tepidisphaeraceae bacterium]
MQALVLLFRQREDLMFAIEPVAQVDEFASLTILRVQHVNGIFYLLRMAGVPARTNKLLRPGPDLQLITKHWSPAALSLHFPGGIPQCQNAIHN